MRQRRWYAPLADIVGDVFADSLRVVTNDKTWMEGKLIETGG